MSKPLTGLLYDLDGTLLDSAADLRQALNMTLAQHNRRALDLAEVKSMLGDGMMMLVQRAFEATGGMPDGDIFKYVQQNVLFYRALTPDPSQVFDGGREILAAFAKAGLKQAVCTNKPEEASKSILEQLGILAHFTFVGGGDTFPVHKPNPAHVQGVIEAMGVAKDGCVFIGDGHNDVFAAHGAGLPCVVIANGYTLAPEDLEADKTIDSIKELPAALEELGFALPQGFQIYTKSVGSDPSETL